jgi:hypothetical protein
VDIQRAATDRLSLTPEVQYVWSPRYVAAAVLWDRNTNGDGLCDGERLYYLNDANFNVTTLVATNGDAVGRFVYEAYGTGTIMMMTMTSDCRRLRVLLDEIITAILLCL